MRVIEIGQNGAKYQQLKKAKKMTEIERGYKLTFVDENGNKCSEMFKNREQAMYASISVKEPVIEEFSIPKLNFKGEYNYVIPE